MSNVLLTTICALLFLIAFYLIRLYNLEVIAHNEYGRNINEPKENI